MTEALDRVLAAHDRLNRVHGYFASIGCTDEQASTAAKAHADKFDWNGAVLSFQGKPVADGGVAEWFKENKLGFLLPADDSTNDNTPDVDKDTLTSAKAGNLTAYARIVKQHGKETADKLIAKKPGDDKAKDASTNPWRSPDFRTDKAAQAKAAGIIRSLGTRTAASLARSAGKTIDGSPLKAA